MASVLVNMCASIRLCTNKWLNSGVLQLPEKARGLAHMPGAVGSVRRAERHLFTEGRGASKQINFCAGELLACLHHEMSAMYVYRTLAARSMISFEILPLLSSCHSRY